MPRTWFFSALSVLLFQGLVIFQVAAAELDKNETKNCETQLTQASANPNEGLLDILRVRIMPAGSDPISWSSTHESFLLAPPEPLVEAALPGHAQGLIKLGRLGTFAIFVRAGEQGAQNLVVCRSLNYDQCVFSHSMGRGEILKGIYMLKQEIDETVVQVDTNQHQFILKLTR